MLNTLSFMCEKRAVKFHEMNQNEAKLLSFINFS